MTIENKVIWITGASSGIGESLAYALSGMGAKLILSARREQELARVAKNCKVQEDRIKILPLNLADNGQAEEWVKNALQTFGNIDIVINNGGMGHLGNVTEMSPEVERLVLETNFWGHVNITKAILPYFIKQNKGSIVTIGSILGFFGSPGLAAYSASKHALYGYFESLREELADTNLHIMMVSPGFINTNVTKSSLKADGEVYGKNSAAQEKGMSSTVLAQKLVAAMVQEKDNVTIGKWETLSVPFKKIAPKTFYKAMRFLTKRARKK